MILGSGCLGARSLDGAAIAGALGALGLDRVLLVAGDGGPARGLSGLRVAGVRARWADLPRGLAAARLAGAGRLVLELRDGVELPVACREVFDLARRHPGLELAVATPARGPLAAPDELALLLEDLAARAVRYWHVPSRAGAPGAGDAAWLDGLSRWLAGLSLDDAVGELRGLPPGLGEMDFRRLSPWAARAVDVALDVDPLPDPALLRPALEVLAAAGLT